MSPNLMTPVIMVPCKIIVPLQIVPSKWVPMKTFLFQMVPLPFIHHFQQRLPHPNRSKDGSEKKKNKKRRRRRKRQPCSLWMSCCLRSCVCQFISFCLHDCSSNFPRICLLRSTSTDKNRHSTQN